MAVSLLSICLALAALALTHSVRRHETEERRTEIFCRRSDQGVPQWGGYEAPVDRTELQVDAGKCPSSWKSLKMKMSNAHSQGNASGMDKAVAVWQMYRQMCLEYATEQACEKMPKRTVEVTTQATKQRIAQDWCMLNCRGSTNLGSDKDCNVVAADMMFVVKNIQEEFVKGVASDCPDMVGDVEQTTGIEASLMEKWFDLNIYADFTILQQDAIQRTKWGTNMKDFLKYGQDIGGKQWAILKKIHDTSMDGFVQEQIKSLAGSLESSSEEDDSQKQETFLAKINDFYGELEKASAGQFCSLPTGGARPSPRTVQATSLDATRCISKGGTPNWPKFFERSMELNLAQNDAYITYSCIYHIVIRSQMHIFGFDYENDELHAAAKTCDGEHMLYMARIMKDYKKSGITQEELVYALVKMGKYWSRVFQPMSDEEKALQNFGRSFYDRHTNGPSLSENERKNFCHLILDALNIRWQSKGDAMANLLNKLQEWSTKLQERDDEPAKKLPAPATVATADTLVQAISARTFGVIVQFLAVNFRDEFDHLRQKIKQADPAVPDLIAGFVGRVPNLIAGFVDRPQPAPDAAALLRDAVLESQSHPQEFVPEALRQGLKDKYGRQIVTALRAFRGDMQKVMENMMAANVEFCKAAFKGSVESVAADVLLGGQCLSTMKAAA